MSGWRTRLAKAVAFVFTRVLCPPFLLVGGIDGYAACILRGMRIVAMLAPCDCEDLGEELSLVVQALTVSSLLYASIVARVLGVERSMVVRATAPAWRALLATTLGMANDSSGINDSGESHPTMFT